MAIQETFRTVQDAAGFLGVTEGRIRQILTREAPSKGVEIGTKFGPNWALTEFDLEKIRKFLRKSPTCN